MSETTSITGPRTSEADMPVPGSVRVNGANYMSKWMNAFVRTNHNEASTVDGGKLFRSSHVWVITALATYATYGTGESAFPGNAKLRAMTGLSDASIGRAVSWAKQAGWLEQVGAAAKGHRAAEYRMTFPSSLRVGHP